MTKMQKSYSDAVIGNRIPEDNVGKVLVGKVRQLEKDVPNGNSHLKTELQQIAGSLEIILKNHEEDRATKQKQINDLQERISTLEMEIETIKQEKSSTQQKIDGIDVAEAMKVMEFNVASFVLPHKEKIAKTDGFGQISMDSESAKENSIWDFLQKQGKIVKWTEDHKKIKTSFIIYRNNEAHHKRFDLGNLRKAMIDEMPHYQQHCNDIVNIFQIVESLLKLGMLASEPGIKRRLSYSQGYVDLLSVIEKECYRDVKYLQDINIEVAKGHLVQYFMAQKIPTNLLDDVIREIENTNCPRLGKLVIERELQIVSRILQKPDILTFHDMDDYFKKGKGNRSSKRQAQWWQSLNGGKNWSENHSAAMDTLKDLCQGNQSERIDPLPINIAKLHIPDFLVKNLWDAGSDILQIFERFEKNRKE